jgi:Na+/proline symporter
MLVGLIVCIVYIMNNMGHSIGSTLHELNVKGLTKIFNVDVKSSGFFLKQLIGGLFITVTMTGLDQEMMQKNISVRTLNDSQKNVLSFSGIILIVNFLFLLMGGLLYLFAASKGISTAPDDLFPTVALHSMGNVIPIIFVIGLISALFPSADGALTALTSSFCIDLLGMKRRDDWDEKRKRRNRMTVHFIFAVVFFLMVMGFKWVNNKSIIDVILKVAGFTYGPLLGLFGFGILTKRSIADKLAIYVCLAAPIIIWGIDFINNIEWYQQQFHLSGKWVNSVKNFSRSIFDDFKIGYELLIYNGLLTFLGLWMISKKAIPNAENDR